MCKAKINKEIDLDWGEISSLLCLGISADHLRKTAYGLMEYDNYLHSDTGIENRILCLSDFHVPYQLSVHNFVDYVDNLDILVLNGDIVDMQAISKFPKQYRISPMEEVIQGRQYLIELIEYLKPRKVIVNYGNHDKRFASYLSKHLDSDLLELMPDTVLELILLDGFHHYDKRTKAKTHYKPLVEVFHNLEIYYTNDWKYKIGKTWFAHPTLYSSSGTLKTSEKAMDYFHRTDKEDFDCLVVAHTHSTAYSKKGYIHLYEQGACCQVDKMDYTNGTLSNPQKMGFVYLCQDTNGNLLENKTKLIHLN